MFRDERTVAERKVRRQQHERSLKQTTASSSKSTITARPLSPDRLDPLRVVTTPRQDLAAPSFLRFIFSEPALRGEISIGCLSNVFQLSYGDDALSAVVSAVGFASMAQRSTPSDDLAQAKRRYVKAIHMTRAAIEQPKDCQATTKLVLVTILLSMFEVLVSQINAGDDDRTYFQHLQGAATLVGVAMGPLFDLKDRTAVSVMLQLRIRLVRGLP